MTAYMPHNSQREREDAALLVTMLLADGCTVSVHDGEDWALNRSTDRSAILAAMGTTEADSLLWRTVDGIAKGEFVLIYGNGPGELIADHTDNPACHHVAERWAFLSPG